MIVVVLALGGFAVLIARRRLLEAVVFAVPIATITAIGAVTLASSRRSEVLMTLVFPLAATAVTRSVAFARERAADRAAARASLAQRRPGLAPEPRRRRRRAYPLPADGAPPPRSHDLRKPVSRELTALRSAGLIAAAGIIAFAVDPPPLAAQRGRADPAARPASGWRSSPAPS